MLTPRTNDAIVAAASSVVGFTNWLCHEWLYPKILAVFDITSAHVLTFLNWGIAIMSFLLLLRSVIRYVARDWFSPHGEHKGPWARDSKA